MSKVYLVSVDKMLGNNLLRNKMEKENPEYSKDYVDINEILKSLSEYVEQVNKKNKQ